MELFRYFQNSEFAEDLCTGIVSFALLSLYTDRENSEQLGSARYDEQEGRVNTLDSFGTTSHKVFSNQTRILCFSTALDPKLEDEFGRFIVRITDADKLGSLLSEALENQPYKTGDLRHQLVNYTDEPIAAADYKFIHSQCFTKPQKYSNQMEYRYVFVEKDDLSNVASGNLTIQNSPRREIRLPKLELNGLLERIK